VPDFAFASCLPGVEPAVKLEVARDRPDLAFAFSRPGLVTFKSTGAITPDDPPASAFARVWGKSLGTVVNADAVREQLAELGVTRVHVYSRDPELAADLAPWDALGPHGPAQGGELVANIIVPPGLASAEAAFLGIHRHDPTRGPEPGGGFGVVVPEDAPSRAYAKIEEAIAWAKLPIAAGQVALEIGAAPGGAVLALARRGLTVWGVDTGELAPVVRALPNVTHVAKKVGAVRWEELPPRIDWLLVDVNLAPQVALHEISRLMPKLRPTLRGAVITLKLNDWGFVAELPKLVQRIRDLGLTNVRLRHLPANRKEVCAVALP
jgi:23S rRNA (cytidine2498-2'-O)-methyltransferase